jgi:hypothetical protein
MYNLEQLANAQMAVYVVSTPDGSDCEFLPLAPMASASDLEDLRARWPGRNLRGVGVAGLVNCVPTLMLREPHSDLLMAVRLTVAFAQYVQATLNDGPTQQCIDDSAAWCEQLYALQDPRTN